jgi:DNA helicase-2/ATP-dependent DNA helicase PcrA
MELACDLHIHSHYSRATSRDLDLPHLYQWAQRKGIDIIGTGDFTHPGWRDELRRQLVPSQVSGTVEPGFYELHPDLRAPLDAAIPRACRRPVRFVLTAEVSHIFKKDGAVRKVHNLALVPDLMTADALCERLLRLGCNLTSDGRPIFGVQCRDFFELVLESHPLSYLIPAHIWTPHFSVFGSLSGFDTLEACFGDLTPQLFALETGLSSDPAMNHRLSMLDRYTLVSNSDAHSPAKLGRELNLLDLGSEPTFAGLRRAIEHCAPDRFLGTVEFYPEEGKYHLDGHRDCKVRLEPAERLRLGGKCPVCGRPVTVGVQSRVEALADRPADSGYLPPRARPFTSLVPLTEVLAEVYGVGAAAESVQRAYFRLLDQLGSELYILRSVDTEALAGSGVEELLGEALRRVRSGRLQLAGGYDGEYGTVRIFDPSERTRATPRSRQINLFDPHPHS